MIGKINQTKRIRIGLQMLLVAIFALALAAPVSAAALAAPVSAAALASPTGDQAQDCEGSQLEFCLRWGTQPAPAMALIPVTGASSRDFGYSYWLIVGPAGGQPVGLQGAR